MVAVDINMHAHRFTKWCRHVGGQLFLEPVAAVNGVVPVLPSSESQWPELPKQLDQKPWKW